MKCCLCGEKYEKGGLRSFHRFPANKNEIKQWLTAMHQSNAAVSTTSRVCSDHFLPEDYRETKHGQKLLKENVIPCLEIHEVNRFPHVGMSQGILTENSENITPFIPFKRITLTESSQETSSTLTASLPSSPSTLTASETERSFSDDDDVDVNNGKKELATVSSSSTITASETAFHLNEGEMYQGPRKRYIGDFKMEDLENPYLCKQFGVLAKKTILQQRQKIQNLQKQTIRMKRRIYYLHSLIKNIKRMDHFT